MQRLTLPTNPKYLVSSAGDVISCWRKPFVVLKPRLNNSGYLVVNLWDGSAYVTKLVHRLVAETFLNLQPDQVVNHKDNIRTNNGVENLEVCTQHENVQHALKIGAIPTGQRHYNAKLSDADAEAIRQSTASLSEIAKMYGISKSHACGIRNGQQRRTA